MAWETACAFDPKLTIPAGFCGLRKDGERMEIAGSGKREEPDR